MEEKLQELLKGKATPEWCALLEEIIGQIGNYMNREWDYDLAEKYHPDIFAFTVEDIPEDWLAFAYACVERVGL